MRSPVARYAALLLPLLLASCVRPPDGVLLNETSQALVINTDGNDVRTWLRIDPGKRSRTISVPFQVRPLRVRADACRYTYPFDVDWRGRPAPPHWFEDHYRGLGKPSVLVRIAADFSIHLHGLEKDGSIGPEVEFGGFPFAATVACDTAEPQSGA